MDFQKLQIQYDKIYSYFKTTAEPFDELEWDGKILKVWQLDKLIEKYKIKNLK